VIENLSFWRDFLGGKASDARESLKQSLAAVGLDHAIHLPAAYLSAGPFAAAASLRHGLD
jgi:heme exporter protein A